MLNILGLCVFGFGFGLGVLGQDCSNKTQQLCLGILTRNGIDLAHVDDDVPMWNETEVELKQRCRVFSQFSNCMETVTSYCADNEKAKYKGWDDAYKFLCEDKSNLTAVATYLHCYGSDVVNSSAIECSDQYHSKVSTLRNGTNSIPPDKKDDYCKIADAYFKCLNISLNTNCGSGPAEWQWSWARRLSAPVLLSCPGWGIDYYNDYGGSVNSWTVALIAVFVAIAGIMIIAIVFMLVFLFKKRKERSRIRQIRQRNCAPPPPPYSAVVYSSDAAGGEPQAHLVDSSVVVPPGELGLQGRSAAPPSDVVLPPTYTSVVDRTPAPDYESLENVPPEAKEEGEEGAEGAAHSEHNRTNESDRNKRSEEC